MEQLLGETLLQHAANGSTGTAEALKDYTVIGLYFSASWCAPCREFTPKLVEFYKHIKAKEPTALEIVLLPRDNDEEAHDKYWAAMPWPSLSLAQRDTVLRLTSTYQVVSLPSLILVDAEGNVITSHARRLVLEDADGTEFPWRPKPLKELMLGRTLIAHGDSENRVSATEVLDSGKYLGIYFGASWSQPCRKFNQILEACYKRLQRTGKPFEVILVSSDNDAAAFRAFYKKMPWLALPFSERRLKEKLTAMFDVRTIPTMVVLSPQLDVITLQGKSEVSEDPTGARFPWRPSALFHLTQNRAGQLNQEPFLLYFTDGTDYSLTHAEELLQPLADREQAAAVQGGYQPLRMFIVGRDLETGDIVREFADLPDDEPLVALLDIPKQRKFLVDSSKQPSARTIKDLLQAYHDKTVAWKSLSTH